MKTSVGAFTDPTSPHDAVPKEFADEAYAGLHAARGDYIYASIGASTVYSDGGTIVFDTVDSQRGEITISSNRFSLKAGRTYQLISSIRMTHSGVAVFPFQWYDFTASAFLGTEARARTGTSSVHETSNQPAAYIFTPLVDTEVEVRMQTAGSPDSDAVFGFAMITEIGANVVSAAGDYIHADLSETKTPSAGAPIEFDNVLSNRGQLSLDIVTNVGRFSGLKAGRTYKLIAVARINTSVQQQPRWRDLTAGAYIGNFSIVQPMDSGVVSSSQPVAVAFITPTVDTEVEFWSVDASGSYNIYCNASIEEMGASPSALNPYPPNHIDDLDMVFNSVRRVDIGPGTARDSTNLHNIDVEATLTADMETSGVDGLDTGAEADETWYAVYVIKDTLGSNPIASLLSVSFTSPTMPSGYDVFRRVGAVRNKSNDFVTFNQKGKGRTRQCTMAGSSFIVNAFTGSIADQVTSAAEGIPPSSTRGIFALIFLTTTNTHFFILNDALGNTRDQFGTGAAASSTGVRLTVESVVDGSQNLYWRNNSTLMTASIYVLGYYDDL